MTTRPVVLVTDHIDPVALPILEEAATVRYEKSLSHEQLLALIPEVDALLVRSASQVSADVLAASQGRLKIVGRAGVGTDNIDLAAATRAGVVVVNSPEGNTVAAAEHTIGMLLAVARNIAQGDHSLKQGQWQRSQLVGNELFGKTLGVVGMGKIGQRVAKACQAMGMKVQVFDPYLSASRAQELDVKSVTLEHLLASSDFMTLHVPKTKETTHLLNADSLKRCKPGVRIVNCARGGIIDEDALVEAVLNGQVAGVGLDVFAQEPLAADSPLLSLGSKAVLTPHLGASTEEAQLNVAIDVAEQVRDFFLQGYARSAVNLPLLRKEKLDPVWPYMGMAEAMANLVRQLLEAPVARVALSAKGVALHNLDIQPLSLAVLKGLLSGAREGVTYVNAPGLAEELGIEVELSSSKEAGNTLNLLCLRVVDTEGNEKTVSATLVADGQYRFVELNGYVMALEPAEHLLLTPHRDQPGMVAHVAQKLGAAQINISAMQVARRSGAPSQTAGGESVMIFSLDTPPEPATLSEITQLPGIFGAKLVQLP
ncbi:MAG: phosphoglycerate dehydrogenase [Vampirovibrionales bacterium]|nr:phosphoglycerate dehydrogenase [Vampirovibrionales bacterium]